MPDDAGRNVLEHRFLDAAKSYDWIDVAQALNWDPTLINVNPSGRWTALHQAVRADAKPVVEWLLHCHADPTMKTARGSAPMELTNNPEIIHILMAAIDDNYRPKVAPPDPTAVGGFLPELEGGNAQNYYWPQKYHYNQTFRGMAAARPPPPGPPPATPAAPPVAMAVAAASSAPSGAAAVAMSPPSPAAAAAAPAAFAAPATAVAISPPSPAAAALAATAAAAAAPAAPAAPAAAAKSPPWATPTAPATPAASAEGRTVK